MSKKWENTTTNDHTGANIHHCGNNSATNDHTGANHHHHHHTCNHHDPSNHRSNYNDDWSMWASATSIVLPWGRVFLALSIQTNEFAGFFQFLFLCTDATYQRTTVTIRIGYDLSSDQVVFLRGGLDHNAYGTKAKARLSMARILVKLVFANVDAFCWLLWVVFIQVAQTRVQTIAWFPSLICSKTRVKSSWLGRRTTTSSIGGLRRVRERTEHSNHRELPGSMKTGMSLAELLRKYNATKRSNQFVVFCVCSVDKITVCTRIVFVSELGCLNFSWTAIGPTMVGSSWRVSSKTTPLGRTSGRSGSQTATSAQPTATTKLSAAKRITSPTDRATVRTANTQKMFKFIRVWLSLFEIVPKQVEEYFRYLLTKFVFFSGLSINKQTHMFGFHLLGCISLVDANERFLSVHARSGCTA